MFKKFITALWIICFFSLSLNVIAETEEKPNITSSAYVLYNPDNNEMVDSKNAHVKMYPASLTKMMTAIVVTDLCDDLDEEKVTVSENAVKSLYGTGSSTANIKIGEIFTVKQLLYLMLLPSGNDAANAIADHYNSNGINFIEKMNDKAKELGMNDTNFVNPHGLHDDNHYTTAADLSILADEYMKDTLLCEIARCNEYTVPQTNLQGERVIRSTNYLKIPKSSYYYEYATGLKTGNTDKAGRCLAASAEKGGVKYICILLDTPEAWNKYGLIRTDFQEATEIFKYAFNTYECVKIADKDKIVSDLPVYETRNKRVDLVLKQDIFATLPKGTDLSGLRIDFTPINLLEGGFADSPVKAGTSFGEAKLILDNKVLGACEVVALENVEPNKLIVFWHKIDFYVFLVVGIIAFLIIMFVLLIIRKKVVLYKRRKAKEKRELHRKRLQEAFDKQAPYNYFKMD